MELEIKMAISTETREGPGAFSLVATDLSTQRIIHEESSFQESFDSRTHLEYLALIHGIQLAKGMGTQRLILMCCSELLVNQVTGINQVEDEIMALFSEAIPLLFAFESWEIRCIDPEDNKKAQQLATQALIESDGGQILNQEQASLRQHPQHTGVPQWLLEALEDPLMDCPCEIEVNLPYPFGPDVPSGLCVYAVQSSLNEGPLSWKDPTQKRLTTICPHCEIPLRLTRLDS